MNTLVMWLALVPAAAVVVSAWERRRFWRHPEYILVNKSLATLGVGLLLMSPAADALGAPVGIITGRWHGEDVMGHTLVVIGFLCLTAHAMRACTWLTSRTLAIATHGACALLSVLWVLWARTDMSSAASPTIYRDGGVLYWTVLSTGLGGMAVVAFLIFWYIYREAPRASMIRCAQLYMVGSGFLALSCAHRGYELATGSFGTVNVTIDYLLRTVAVTAVAVAAHHTFKQLKKPVNVPASLSRSFA